MAQLSEWSFKLLIAVALPTVTCFGYYSLEYLEDPNTVTVLFVMMSYPVALIALVGFFRAVFLPNPAKWVLLSWGVCVVIPIAILIWLRM